MVVHGCETIVNHDTDLFMLKKHMYHGFASLCLMLSMVRYQVKHHGVTLCVP